MTGDDQDDQDGSRAMRRWRERCHARLIADCIQDPNTFHRYVMEDNEGKPWEVAPFHEEWQAILSGDLAVEGARLAHANGKGDPLRIAIHAPIKHGKTEQVSIGRVLWELGRNPDLRVGICTGTSELATKISFALRVHCESNARLHEVFPHLTRGRRWTEDGFDIAGRRRVGSKDFSVCIAMIEGRGTLGSRFDLVIIDDANNHQNTGTAAARQKAYDWVKSTLLGRLEAGGRAWAIGTTWNQDDLLFRLVADGWAHVLYRASTGGRTLGDLLWPRPGQREYLESLLRPQNLGEREYARQCDNDPISRVGDTMHREWLYGPDGGQSYVLDGIAPSDWQRMRRIRFWDLAATDGSKAAGRSSGPCWTAGVLMGLLDGRTFVLDVRRIQGAPDAVEHLIQTTAASDGRETPIRIEMEPGSHSPHLEYQFRKSVLLGYNLDFRRPKGDKVTRALPFASHAKGGLVRMMRGAWNAAYVDEWESFPHGAFKDQVDATSGAFAELTEHGAAVTLPQGLVACR